MIKSDVGHAEQVSTSISTSVDGMLGFEDHGRLDQISNVSGITNAHQSIQRTIQSLSRFAAALKVDSQEVTTLANNFNEFDTRFKNRVKHAKDW